MTRWRDHIPREEFEVYSTAGFAKRQTPGKHPALLVVDCTLAFIGSAGQKTVKEAIREYRTACGPAGYAALPFIREAIARFRTRQWPVIFSRPSISDQRAAGEATKAGKGSWSEEGNLIPEEIAPLAGEWVVEKAMASCFFGTPLATCLVRMRVDTLVVVGVSTSGCVRASVTDAFSHGFTVFLIEEACFDRSAYAHAANLFDMDAKYANVVTFEEFKAIFP